MVWIFVCFQKRPYCHTTNHHSHPPGATARLGRPHLKGQRVLVKEKGRGDSTSAPPQSRVKAATWGPTRSTLESYVSLNRLFWYNFNIKGAWTIEKIIKQHLLIEKNLIYLNECILHIGLEV